MPKPYLLTAGDGYYPRGGDEDWIATFTTEEEAENAVGRKEWHTYYTTGKSKGQIRSTHLAFIINDVQYDWYEIIDLRKWQ